jgi:hypothetical protein
MKISVRVEHNGQLISINRIIDFETEEDAHRLIGYELTLLKSQLTAQIKKLLNNEDTTLKVEHDEVKSLRETLYLLRDGIYHSPFGNPGVMRNQLQKLIDQIERHRGSEGKYYE